MCHHTREPTVLSKVSCRPPHLNFDRFHQPCLLPGPTSRIGEDCRFPVPPNNTLPLRAARLFLLLRLTRGFCHDDYTVPRQDVKSSFPPCTCHPPVWVFAHTGSGPSRVCRRLFTACLGDPSPLASVLTGISDLKLCLGFVVYSLHVVTCLPLRLRSKD